jgi:hypothetical protein
MLERQERQAALIRNSKPSARSSGQKADGGEGRAPWRSEAWNASRHVLKEARMLRSLRRQCQAVLKKFDNKALH